MSGHATVLASNVRNIAARTYPAYNDPNSPYSEMGVDYNASNFSQRFYRVQLGP